jgi:hypothetical protein
VILRATPVEWEVVGADIKGLSTGIGDYTVKIARDISRGCNR